MTPANVAAIIWDIDDVLVATSKARTTIQSDFLGELGLTEVQVNTTLAAWDRLFWYFGTHEHTHILTGLRAELPWGEKFTDAAIARYDATMTSNFLRVIQPAKDVTDILELCRTRALPIGIASNGSEELQWAKLKITGVANYFSNVSACVIARAANGKPKPDTIIAACKALDVAPSDTIYVGDRMADVIAAKLAGCQSVRLNFTAPEAREPSMSALELEVPQHLVNSLIELTELVWTFS